MRLLLVLVLVGYRKAGDENDLKEQHPDEPWKWQKDWLEGRM